MLNYINLLCLLTGEGRHSRGKSNFTINNQFYSCTYIHPFSQAPVFAYYGEAWRA